MASTRDPPAGLRSICYQARLNPGPDTGPDTDLDSDPDTDPDTDPALDPDLDLLNSSAFGCFLFRLIRIQAPRPIRRVGTPNPIPIPREILSDRLRLLLGPSGCPLGLITTVCEVVFVVELICTVGKGRFIVGVGNPVYVLLTLTPMSVHAFIMKSWMPMVGDVSCLISVYSHEYLDKR
jgi:hypothetical protein